LPGPNGQPFESGLQDCAWGNLFKKEKDSSFSEEKEAKRLLFLARFLGEDLPA
jgi:hypothetical protein